MADKSPVEEFKRALTQTMRSIAEEAELAVSFGSDKPSLAGLKARLPQPARDLDPVDRANVRGQSDSFALKLAHNDAALAFEQAPAETDARASLMQLKRRAARPLARAPWPVSASILMRCTSNAAKSSAMAK